MTRLIVDNLAHARTLKGSPRTDDFKSRHKEMGPGFEACDVDLALVEYRPFDGVVAFLEVKSPVEDLSSAQVIAFTELLKIAPIYVVYVDNAKTGPFEIWRYHGGDWHPRPPTIEKTFVARCKTWNGFKEWQTQLRQQWRAARR